MAAARGAWRIGAGDIVAGVDAVDGTAACGVLSLELRECGLRPGRQLRPAGFPAVDGGEGHAKAAGQLLLAEPEAAAQESQPRCNRFRIARLAHAGKPTVFRALGHTARTRA